MLANFAFLLILVARGCDLNLNLILQSNSLLPEASDIVKVGLYYYVVGDDTCAVTKVSQDGTAVAIPTEQCSDSDFEALFRLPGDLDDDEPTLIICKEDARNCSPWKNGQFVDNWSLIDGGDGCHDDVNWGNNKGIEGALGLTNSEGETFMIALIEGTGSIITYRLDSNQSKWVSQSCTSVPASFSDFSGMSMFGSHLAVVSQSSKKMWVGQITQLFPLDLAPGLVHDFPSSFKGVEGIFIETLDAQTGSMSGVICSDDQGSGNYQNAVHSFTLTCEAPDTQSTTTNIESTSIPAVISSTSSAMVSSTYYISSVGYCDSKSELIESESECENAALELGLSDVSVQVISNEDRPVGCYFKESAESNQLWLNTDDEGESNSDNTSRRSLCLRTQTVTPTTSTSDFSTQSPSQFTSTTESSVSTSTLTSIPSTLEPTAVPTSIPDITSSEPSFSSTLTPISSTLEPTEVSTSIPDTTQELTSLQQSSTTGEPVLETSDLESTVERTTTAPVDFVDEDNTGALSVLLALVTALLVLL